MAWIKGSSILDSDGEPFDNLEAIQRYVDPLQQDHFYLHYP